MENRGPRGRIVRRGTTAIAAALSAAALLALPCGALAAARTSPSSSPSSSRGARRAHAAHGAKRHRGRRRRRGHSAGSAPPPVTISPLPGTPDASPHTQISFLGAPLDEISHISVVGSRSGGHTGKLEPYASAPGGSFLPSHGFVQGEQVKVSAMVGPAHSQHRVASEFTVARHFDYRFPPRPKPHTATTSSASVRSFVSEPSLHPSTLSVSVDSPQASPGDVFYAFNGGQAQWGPMIVNGEGHLIWFQPMPGAEHAMDFKEIEYEGQPALVWWQGTIPPIGVGFGEDVICNDHYQQVARIKAGNGYWADLHEVLITPQGQAYTTAVSLVQENTTSKGGFLDGGVIDSVIQEIDIKTGLVMWEWHALGHVPLSESFSNAVPHAPGWPLDYFHANSISLNPYGNGNLLVSSRNTWAGYEIDHQTGQILWRLGGKHSSFKMGPKTQTAYQHDIKWQPNGTITIFDNGGSPAVHPQSRVLHEQIDWKARKVELISEHFHSPALAAASQGDDEMLANGSSFVGWGAEPYITEFAPNGTVLFDAQLPSPGESYRAYRFPWQATPAAKPAVGVHANSAGAATVYASWNGATDVTGWRVLGWDTPKHIEVLATAARSGFETAIPVKSADAWFAAQPLGPSGEVLAVSRATKR